MLLTSVIRRVSVLAVVGLLVPVFAKGETSKQSAMESEGLRLIGQLEDAARAVQSNADQLESFTRSTSVSKWTH